MGEKLHESDRLVIAGEPVPEELAPVDNSDHCRSRNAPIPGDLGPPVLVTSPR